MSTSVEIVGGPRDGEIWQVQGKVPLAIFFEVPPATPAPWRPQSFDHDRVPIRKAAVPVRLTRNGYRAFWNERSES